MPLFLVRCLLSVNFSVSLLIAVMCGYILVRVPTEVMAKHGPEISRLENHAIDAKQNELETLAQIKAIRQESTAKILKEGLDLLKTAIGLAATIVTTYTSYKMLHKDGPPASQPGSPPKVEQKTPATPGTQP